MALRVEIDGQWNAAEFSAFYGSINELYQFMLFDRDPQFRDRGPNGQYIGYRRHSMENLQVSQISFASPGFTDLAGIAAVVRELREFIQFLIVRIGGREDRELARELTKVQIAKEKLGLLQLIASSEEFQPGQRERFEALLSVRGTQLPDIDPLIDAVIDGRVVGCSSVDADGKKTE